METASAVGKINPVELVWIQKVKNSYYQVDSPTRYREAQNILSLS
jgi:hypothetical protein